MRCSRCVASAACSAACSRACVGGRLRPATALGISLVGVGLLSFVFVNISEPVVAYATIAVMGVLVIPGMAGQQTLLQTNADDQLLGRVFGALGTTMAVTMLIGSLAGGALAQVVGVVPLLNVAAVLYTVAGLLALVLLSRGDRKLRCRRRSDRLRPR